ncbi:MAG: hypothetical protein JG768_1530 [Fusobacteriales bacterium]|jgi:hypothetical protein|nr:hypothetical protein [Fusobacteriales bacterium]
MRKNFFHLKNIILNNIKINNKNINNLFINSMFIFSFDKRIQKALTEEIKSISIDKIKYANIDENANKTHVIKKIIFLIIESIILFGGVFGYYFYLSPFKENFISLNIHPFIIIIALIAIRYGNYLTLISSTIASGFFIFSYYLLGKDIVIFFNDFAHYKFLLMFYITGIFIGKIKDDYSEKIALLSKELEILEDNYNELRDTFDKNEFIKKELKKQIITSEESIFSLYEIANSIEKLDSEEVFTEIIGVITKFLKAKTVSYYTLNNYKNFLRLKIRYGNHFTLPTSIDIRKEEFSYLKNIIEKREYYKISEENSNTPIMSAPIIAGSEILGIINVEEVDFEHTTEYTFNLFKIIIDWTNNALENAVNYKLASEGKIKIEKYYKDTQVYKNKYFIERVLLEEERKTKYNLNYIILEYKNNLNFTPLDIEEKFRKVIRDVDILGYDNEKKLIKILLPATDIKYLDMIRERIESKLDFDLVMYNEK